MVVGESMTRRQYAMEKSCPLMDVRCDFFALGMVDHERTRFQAASARVIVTANVA